MAQTEAAEVHDCLDAIGLVSLATLQVNGQQTTGEAAAAAWLAVAANR